MSLVTVQDLSIGFRGPNLLDAVNFQIEPQQRIGLLGRNGAGKTTLMKMLSGQQQPDSGSIQIHQGVHLAMLKQEVPRDIVSKNFDVVRAGIADNTAIEWEDWEAEHETEKILTRMGLEPEGRFEELSSGMKRRVLLARALVTKPDLLLLDEPTNHLDIDSIAWLEDFLLKMRASFLFVTHDRMFLQRLSNRILEIDRGRLFDWSCDYQTFLQRKQDSLDAEEKQNALFDKKLAEEEVWIRKGIKARRTRNEGRVRALKALREERGERRSKVGTSNLQIQEGQRSGNLIVEATDVSFEYGEHKVFENFTTTIMREDKIGIIGHNGAGKTTLLKTLLGQLKPTSGKIKVGTNLQIAYFDQLRQQLDEEETVQVNVGGESDNVLINGVKKHVLGYLQDFLFPPDRARTQVKFLSGGEKNRILLAKLFAQPANVIVLDEPTNDLDSETLELLEERLVQFTGTVLMVSHDRAFLNNVVTSTIVFEPEGLREYVGGYDDWQHQLAARNSLVEKKPSAKLAKTGKKNKKKRKADDKSDKLSFKEQQELDKLPGSIEKLEASIETLTQTMADPEFYQGPKDKISSTQQEMSTLNEKLKTAYARWEELEARVA